MYSHYFVGSAFSAALKVMCVQCAELPPCPSNLDMAGKEEEKEMLVPLTLFQK